MTIASTGDLPILTIYKTGRDYTITSILIINQETRNKYTLTENYSENGNILTIDLTLSGLLAEIKDNTAISVICYNGTDIIVYRDIVVFNGVLNTEGDYEQLPSSDEYVFIE
jgi:hypothetical protein